MPPNPAPRDRGNTAPAAPRKPDPNPVDLSEPGPLSSGDAPPDTESDKPDDPRIRQDPPPLV